MYKILEVQIERKNVV